MSDFILSYNLSVTQWVLLGICGLLIGMSKTGLSGVGLMVVPILANAFGGRPSVGLLLPILIFADVFAVSWYNRHAEWKHILRLIPWAFLGIAIATLVGKSISDLTFNRLLAAVVVVGIVILVWRDLRSDKMKIPTSKWFAAGLGLMGGFATMIGNAAGPVMALYLLSMRLPKNSLHRYRCLVLFHRKPFQGTSACLVLENHYAGILSAGLFDDPGHRCRCFPGNLAGPASA